jgi:hypothetical protein
LQKRPTKAFAKEPYKRVSILANEPTIWMHVCVVRAIQRLHLCVYRLRLSLHVYVLWAFSRMQKYRERELQRKGMTEWWIIWEREKTRARERASAKRCFVYI